MTQLAAPAAALAVRCSEPRRRAAGGRHAAGRAGPDHRARRQRQDHDAHRAARRAAGSRRAARADRGRHLQPRGGAGADRPHRVAAGTAIPAAGRDRGADPARPRAPGPARPGRGASWSTTACRSCAPSCAGRPRPRRRTIRRCPTPRRWTRSSPPGRWSGARRMQPGAGRRLSGHAGRAAAVDFDDLVAGAADAAGVRRRASACAGRDASPTCASTSSRTWMPPSCAWSRLLAEPERNLFVVGDDDQTIYAWRLADVRRILELRGALPRHAARSAGDQLPLPGCGRRRSRRLIAVNRERFTKRIDPSPRPRPGTDAVAGVPHRRCRHGPMGWSAWRPAEARPRPHRLLPGAHARRARTDAAGPGPRGRAARDHGAGRSPGGAGPSAWWTPPDGFRVSAVPFDALLGLRAGRGWRRGDASDTLSRRRPCRPRRAARLGRRRSAAWTGSWRRTTAPSSGSPRCAARRADRAGHRPRREGPRVADRGRPRHRGGSRSRTGGRWSTRGSGPRAGGGAPARLRGPHPRHASGWSSPSTRRARRASWPRWEIGATGRPPARPP